MKTEIHFDESGYNMFLIQFNLPKKLLQGVVDAFKKLNIGSLNTQDFQQLFTESLDDLIFDKLSEGKDLVISGMKLNKKAALPLIEKPSGYNDFIDVLQSVKQKLGHNNETSHMSNLHHSMVSNYVIISDTVAVNPDYLKTLKEGRFSYYITNDRQLAYYKALLEFLKAIEKDIDISVYSMGGVGFASIDDFVRLSNDKKTFVIKFNELNSFLQRHMRDNKDARTWY